MSLNETLKTLKSEFVRWRMDFSKYRYLHELAALLPKESTALRQEENLFRGCQSQVWIRVWTTGHFLHLDVDSDSLIVRGILALFRELLEGAPLEEVRCAEFDLLETLGLSDCFPSVRTANIRRLLPEIQRRLNHAL